MGEAEARKRHNRDRGAVMSEGQESSGSRLRRIEVRVGSLLFKSLPVCRWFIVWDIVRLPGDLPRAMLIGNCGRFYSRQLTEAGDVRNPILFFAEEAIDGWEVVVP